MNNKSYNQNDLTIKMFLKMKKGGFELGVKSS